MLTGLRPDELIVDAFPGGILGELCGLELPPSRHIARRLRWPAYEQRLPGPMPRYEVTYALEPLAERHMHALIGCSVDVEPLHLPVPCTDASPSLSDARHWLIVHSGPGEEVAELADYAAERTTAQLLVVTPRRPPELPPRASWLDVHPVTPHLEHAEGIVTAAGFNSMHETAALRLRHRAIPFPRPLDDQYSRASLAAQSFASATAPAVGGVGR
jgi:hypothetical protein